VTTKLKRGCSHLVIRRRTARSINLRYWYCRDCQAIVRFTVVTNRIGQCHAEAGQLVTLHFRNDGRWQEILTKFYPGEEAIVAQGLMEGRIEHSWVEIGDQAFDTNYAAIFDREQYYRRYNIANIRRFTAREFTDCVCRHDRYGYFGRAEPD
jgi:hypothetical protein